MFFSSPDVFFTKHNRGSMLFARPIFPHGEVSGEASNTLP